MAARRPAASDLSHSWSRSMKSKLFCAMTSLLFVSCVVEEGGESSSVQSALAHNNSQGWNADEGVHKWKGRLYRDAFPPGHPGGGGAGGGGAMASADGGIASAGGGMASAGGGMASAGGGMASAGG